MICLISVTAKYIIKTRHIINSYFQRRREVYPIDLINQGKDVDALPIVKSEDIKIEYDEI